MAAYYDLKTTDLRSSDRRQGIVNPRQLAMYILRKELHLSYPRVAASLGRKDHTTAIHSVNKVDAELINNDQLKDDFTIIRRLLKI